MTKAKTQPSGGTEIDVATDKVVIRKEAEEPEPQEQDGFQGEGAVEVESGVTDEQRLVNEALIETLAVVVGKMLVALTKIPDMEFDESEVEQLKNLWSPLMPSLSPKTTAIIGTTIIVGGKVGVYVTHRQPKRLPEPTSPTTTEDQLEKEWKSERANQ